MTWDAFLNQVQSWLECRRLLTPGAIWVVGVSGGPDSTLLLHALKALSERSELGWKLHVAHFHHGLRGQEAEEDAAFVAHLAEALGLPCHTERADIRSEVAHLGGSTEEVARSRRYEFLERVALKTGSERVAVAHHADDNAETILQRICRGTGLRGLAGIRDVRPIRPGSSVLVVRPLLGQRRAVINELCGQLGLQTRCDSSNQTPEFTRGRIRNVVLPLLAEHLNPNVVDALLRLGEHARLLSTYLDDAVARTFESLIIAQRPRQVVLNNRALLSKQRIIQAEVVRRAVALAAESEQEISFGHIETVLRLAEEPTSGKEVHLPGPVVVRKRYDRLEFAPLGDEEPPPELGIVFVACPGRTSLPALRMTITTEIRDVTPEQVAAVLSNTNRYEEWLDFAALRPPLLVRGRRDGDRFHPLGSPGVKTVADFLAEQKIDPQVRSRTGILCDQIGPLWVMPLRIDERAKLTPATCKALRVVLAPFASAPTSST